MEALLNAPARPESPGAGHGGIGSMTDEAYPRTCECGCGASVKNRFLQGHNRFAAPTKPGMKCCSRCQEEKPQGDFYRRTKSPDGLAPLCKRCDNARKKRWIHANMSRHEEFTQKWKKENPEAQAAIQQRAHKKLLERNPRFNSETTQCYRKRYPERDRAHRAVQRAVREGKMVKPNICECCGKQTESPNLDGHHEDYSKPLEVNWLCRQCHLERHRED